MFGNLFKPNIARLKEQRNIEGLFEALDHKDELTRKSAFNALTGIGDRVVLIRLLGRMGGDAWARGVITGKLLVPYPKDEADLVAAIRNPAADATGLDVLFKYLQDVASGAYFINQWQKGGASRVLMALDHPSMSQDALRALVADASGGQSYATREMALRRLEMGSDGDNAAMLASLLEENLNSDLIAEMTDLEGLKATALRRLAEVKHPVAYAALVGVVRDYSDLEDRTAAMVALSRNGVVDVVEPALKLLDENTPTWHDGSVSVARSVGASLGELGLPAMEAITALLHDDIPLKRLCALQALDVMAGRQPEAVLPLVTQVAASLLPRNQAAQFRELATHILTQLGPPVVEPLLRLLPGSRELQELLLNIAKPPVDAIAVAMVAASDLESATFTAQLLCKNEWNPAGEGAPYYFILTRDWDKAASFGPDAVEPIRRFVYGMDTDATTRNLAGGLLRDIGDPARCLLVQQARAGDGGALLALGYMGEDVVSLAHETCRQGSGNDRVAGEALVALLRQTEDASNRDRVLDAIAALPASALDGIPQAMWSDLGQAGDSRQAAILVEIFKARQESGRFGDHQTPMGLRSEFTRLLIDVGEAAVEPVAALMDSPDESCRVLSADVLTRLFQGSHLGARAREKIRSLNGTPIRLGGYQYVTEDGEAIRDSGRTFQV